MQSHGVINVTYNGTPIWINSIKGDHAMVSVIGQDRKMDVPLDSLTENSPM